MATITKLVSIAVLQKTRIIHIMDNLTYIAHESTRARRFGSILAMSRHVGRNDDQGEIRNEGGREVVGALENLNEGVAWRVLEKIDLRRWSNLFAPEFLRAPIRFIKRCSGSRVSKDWRNVP